MQILQNVYILGNITGIKEFTEVYRTMTEIFFILAFGYLNRSGSHRSTRG